MNIFSIVSNLYTNTHCDWISNIEDNEIQPFVIQHFLAMNDAVRVQTRWLDKYVFVLTPKMYLSLAWSILPKTSKAPYVKYIKKVEEEEEFDFILSRIRRQFKLSDNDYNSVKGRLIDYIKKDMVDWFSYYGIPKRIWKKYYLNFDLIKKYRCEDKKKANLAMWGM